MLSDFFVNLTDPSISGIWAHGMELQQECEKLHSDTMNSSITFMQQTWEAMNKYPTLIAETSKDQIASSFSKSIAHETEIRSNFHSIKPRFDEILAQVKDSSYKTRPNFRGYLNNFYFIRNERITSMVEVCHIIEQSDLSPKNKQDIFNTYYEAISKHVTTERIEKKYIKEMTKTWTKFKALAIEK